MMEPAQPSPAARIAPEVAAPTPQALPPEADLWTGRTSWKHYIARITLWIVGNVVAGVLIGRLSSGSTWLTGRAAFWTIVGIVVVSAFLLLLKVVLHILGRRYRLTTQRLFIVTGILSKTTDQTELIRVDDVRVYQSLFDRIFKLGTLSLLSTDVTNRELVIEGVAGAQAVAESVRTHMRAQRSKALFVENL